MCNRCSSVQELREQDQDHVCNGTLQVSFFNQHLVGTNYIWTCMWCLSGGPHGRSTVPALRRYCTVQARSIVSMSPGVPAAPLPARRAARAAWRVASGAGTQLLRAS